MTYIVSYSGGLGSFMAAKLTIDKHGPEKVRLVFTDTKTEDPDLYRFITETSDKLGVELVQLADGRDIWQVFEDVRYHGNNRVDPCSRVLKRDLFRRWLESQYRPDECVIVFGIGPNEAHRMKTIMERWAPYFCEAPLITQRIEPGQIDDALEALRIQKPLLYELGFPHNNCGGFCVKTGQKQMALLLRTMPDRYKDHEARQEKLFQKIGKHGFIRRTENGELKYLSLREFREFLESGGNPDLYDNAGCGCFI
jgi:hypothetical protein